MADVYEMADDYEYDPEKDPDYDPEYDETFQKLAELYYLAQLDDGSRRVIFFDLVKDPPQQKMQADNPEGETSLKKSEQRQLSPPPFNAEVLMEETIGLIERTMTAKGNSEEDYRDTFREVYRLMREMRIAKSTRYMPHSADASQQMTQLAASNDDDEEISLKKSKQKMQADTPEQRQAAADAVNNVLEEMIQLPAFKKICDARHVDVEILTKVLENFKNSITQQTLIQLAKCDQHAHEQPGSADAVNNVSEQMTRLPASKKIRYAHEDDDEEIRAGGGQ